MSPNQATPALTTKPFSLTATDVEAIVAAAEKRAEDEIPRARPEAVAAAKVIDASSGRRDATPVRKVFVRSSTTSLADNPTANAVAGTRPPGRPRDETSPDSETGTIVIPSPLIRLYRGGRSGRVAILLYLALLWRNSHPPHDSSYTYSGWATLLDLDEADTKGARRIAGAVKALAELNLIRVDHVPGKPSRLTLLAEGGSREAYTLPGASYTNAVKHHRGERVLAQHRYFRLNSRLWTTGRLQALPGPALVMLLIILTEWDAETREVWFSGTIFQQRYGLSAPTRAAGIKTLQQRRLIGVEHRALGQWPGATVFDAKRERQVYTLRGVAVPPDDKATTTPRPPSATTAPAAATKGRPRARRVKKTAAMKSTTRKRPS